MLFIIFSSFMALVVGDNAWTEVKTDYGGLTQVSLFSIPRCTTLCSYLEACTTLKYNSSADPPCFVQTGNIEEAGDLKEPSRVFQLDRSIYAGEKCWTKYENEAVDGLIESSFDNLFYCLIYCIGMRNCGGINLKPEGTSKCFVHIGKIMEFKTFKRHAQPNVDTYQLDPYCLFPEGI